MSDLKIVFVDHSETRAKERKLDLRWVERLLRSPDRVEPDPKRSGRLRVFGFVPEISQMLRVVVEPVGEAEWHVVTIFPDRRALKRRQR